MTDVNIVEKAEQHVRKLFLTKSPPENIFHDLNHTINVVEMTETIGKASGLTGDEMEIVLVSAWFHDVGYFDANNCHEENSVEHVKIFLNEYNLPQDYIDKISSCIASTKMPQNPKNLMEQVLCDADLHHLGKEDFFDRNELLRAELEKRNNKVFDDVKWMENNIDFFTGHKFFTKYASYHFDEQKNIHLSKLRKRYRKQLKKNEESKAKNEKFAFEKEKFNNKRITETKADRGIETMFRNVMRTHVSFSAMADNKANIMISVNTLLLTAIVAILMRKLDSNPHLILPTAIITLVSLTTLIYAVLVTRPVVTAGTFTTEDIQQKKTNLLFFGNFYNMNLKDFEYGMLEMMNDRNYLYGNMIKDFYYLGQVLGKKYKYLRICYSIFMYGLIISILAFAIAVLLFEKQTDLGVIIE
jgi:predicted metal-dependent HD superfamily phosphohydrolase